VEDRYVRANQFLASRSCAPAPPRPNTTVLFKIFDDSRPSLLNSPSPFDAFAWQSLLVDYPGDLPAILTKTLQYGALIGYEGPETLILSDNQESVHRAPGVIASGLQSDLTLGRIVPTSTSSPYICSPLGLVPKGDGGWRRIHNLSHPPKRSVNAHIDPECTSLEYTTIEDILRMVKVAGRHCIILKRDIKDAFRNVPIAPHSQWPLGFKWEEQFYKETCLPFGLATAPFIFNLFAEGFHWILQSWLNWDLLQHYLDDFILVIPVAAQHTIPTINAEYIEITNILGIPRNDSKDRVGTVLTVLGLEIDTNLFTLRVPEEKLLQAYKATAKALDQDSITLNEIQSTAGFLGFCAPAVQLGRLHMRTIWTFVASFPQHKSHFVRKRILAAVREDLLWWRDLLPRWNGVLFFDESARSNISIFTDASGLGLGGFFTLGTVNTESVDYSTIPITNAFATPIATQQKDKLDINVHEMDAIHYAFVTWGHSWSKMRVTIYTDNMTCYRGLQKQTLNSNAFMPLRQTLLIAAGFDIVLVPMWIPGYSNTLADALSRFDFCRIANICPHWQDFSSLNPHHHSTNGKGQSST
jgi:reverse transcriptase-like protein